MSGIKILKYLLMKEAAKESVSSSGMTIIDKALRKQVERKVGKWVKSAQRQGSDIDKMSEQEIKYLIELNKPKPPKVISPGDPEHAGITEALLGGLRKTPLPKKSADVFDLTGKKIDTSKPISGGKNVPEVTDVITDTVTKIKTMEPVAAMKEANSVIGRKGIYKNLTKEQSQKILKDTDDWIFQRDPDDLYDYNKKRPFRDDPDTEDFAHGGRSGTGLNYLLGEDDQNMRVPYSKGSRKKSWTDRIAGWTGGTNVMAGEIGLETWDLLNNYDKCNRIKEICSETISSR